MTVLKKYNSVSGLWQPVQVGVPGENSTVPGPTGPTGPTGATPTLVAASTTVSGIVELATAAETLAGTDAVRAVTPIGLEPLRSRLTATVADFTALAALSTTNKLAGDLAFVVEGAVYMSWTGTVWRQVTRARFANGTARDTAYAKASGQYLVRGADVLLSDTALNFSLVGSTWRPDLPGASRGEFSGGTSGNGESVVTHGLGATPSVVMITGTANGVIPERRTYAITGLTPTTFTVRVYRQDTGSVLASNPVGFMWLAIA
jgi:hypothetical protein